MRILWKNAPLSKGFRPLMLGAVRRSLPFVAAMATWPLEAWIGSLPRCACGPGTGSDEGRAAALFETDIGGNSSCVTRECI